MSILPFRVAGVLCVAAFAVNVVSADDNWPRFRGAEGGVAADDPRLPDAWGPSQNVVWQIDIPGWSWSSPVVWGDHVFVTTAVNTVEAEKALPISAYVARSSEEGSPTRRSRGFAVAQKEQRALWFGRCHWRGEHRRTVGQD